MIGIWFLARPLVLDAARVKEDCFSLSFIPAPSCQSWWRATTIKFCRFSGGFAPSPRSEAGGSGQAARQCARSSALPGQTVVGGENEIIVSPPVGNRFYR